MLGSRKPELPPPDIKSPSGLRHDTIASGRPRGTHLPIWTGPRLCPSGTPTVELTPAPFCWAFKTQAHTYLSCGDAPRTNSLCNFPLGLYLSLPGRQVWVIGNVCVALPANIAGCTTQRVWDALCQGCLRMPRGCFRSGARSARRLREDMFPIMVRSGYLFS